MDTRKVIIIGSGPAGYTAGIYASRADLQPLLISGQEAGGQLMQTTEVENWPGEPDGVMGPDLMTKLETQARKFGTEIITDFVTEVDFSSRPFMVKMGEKELKAESIIVATGASAQWLRIKGEYELKGKGVSACATCDGFFFRDKKIVLVGGGDSALEEAIFLTKFASEVVVLVRRDELRASKAMQHRAMSNEKISFMWNSEAQEIVGTDKVKAVMILNNKTDEIVKVEADGFFVAIGHKPNTDIFKGQLEMDEKGYLKHLPDSTRTNIDGVFTAGDVSDPHFRQAITAAGSGCMAALEVERFLANI
ncbi:thioredoxin-disulfide reductase [Candidatus Uhrbacteria bacterium CG_4_10_14_0_2_um_filter_41_7]|uniref:Thioredoxin reductase n=1 Tax=Candidatus Uhrbacteria bacterium CG_4_9_14_3_um_filter_41_35 TaxID=1975034 RepID=A0A2M7XDW7_9BACT|nr:MAG: thioredoxin-disulfide reductase [Candidatus Uhrbacteria bacterium CG11_big_fil_rev_8_21_14_0_20_41_9]PIZ53777.1 MAG: thioredoxin-disulfide reductase [Candidatus Uhrbacteria bacterium CG_4_10_14_0_2_um_filter_41_7]PJA46080.1 MAG: thioredoxin-disulfide reductase [Candidatus Uhrbacteria bacterium CG_4_9_14_3_um_filter_41_35]